MAYTIVQVSDRWSTYYVVSRSVEDCLDRETWIRNEDEIEIFHSKEEALEALDSGEIQ